MTGSIAVAATLVLYQVLLLAVGFWARRRAGTHEGYFIGNRGLGPWVAALSYAAGSSSAWSILGVSGVAFSQGLSAWWIIPGTLSGHLVVWFYIAPRLQAISRSQRWVTLTDLLAHGLQPHMAARVYRLSAVVILFCFVFYIAAQFQGAAGTFTALFQVDFTAALLLGVAVVLAYTLWGGFWAVSITDALQAGLMWLAALLLPLAAWQAAGGYSGIAAAAAPAAAAEAGYWLLLGGETGWFAAGMLLGMFSVGFGPPGQPHLLNRIMALGSARHIRLARTVALVWFVMVLSGMFLLGVCARVLLGAEPPPGAVGAEGVFFVMAEQLLPAVVTGVLVAAVLSAIMSTADSQLLVAAAAIQHDLQRGSSRANGRLAVLAVAAAATLLALFLPESIFSRVLFAWQALGAAFGPIVLARLARWPLPDWSVLAALLAGFGLTVLFYSLPDGPGDLWERGVPFVTAFVTLWLGRASVR